MRKLVALVVASLALYTATALADNGNTRPLPDAHPVPIKEINWDQFRDSCSHPGEFQNQLPPSRIVITCGDSRLTWIQAGAGQVALPETRQVTTEVRSDKYHVQAEITELSPAQKSGSCPRFKEVAETLTIERAVTCDEVLSYRGELKDFCAESLDKTRGMNQRLVKSEDTGRVIDSCAGALPSNPSGH